MEFRFESFNTFNHTQFESSANALAVRPRSPRVGGEEAKTTFKVSCPQSGSLSVSWNLTEFRAAVSNSIACHANR